MSTITVANIIQAKVSKVWEDYNSPESITKWNQASPDWFCPSAESDLRVGGKFSSRMEARDGSAGFDFWGTYDEIITNQLIKYTLGDGRSATITFEPLSEDQTEVTVEFDPESENTIELQRGGWQAVLDSFKKYVEQ